MRPRPLCTAYYSSLVDAFSVTSRHLSRDDQRPAMACRAASRTIYTGVVPTTSSHRSECEGGGRGAWPGHILYPGRLVEQKDPLLMLAAADALRRPCFSHSCRRRGRAGQIATAEQRGLDRHVLLHGPAHDMRPWLAACDLTLMTSPLRRSAVRRVRVDGHGSAGHRSRPCRTQPRNWSPKTAGFWCHRATTWPATSGVGTALS